MKKQLPLFDAAFAVGIADVWEGNCCEGETYLSNNRILLRAEAVPEKWHSFLREKATALNKTSSEERARQTFTELIHSPLVPVPLETVSYDFCPTRIICPDQDCYCSYHIIISGTLIFPDIPMKIDACFYDLIVHLTHADALFFAESQSAFLFHKEGVPVAACMAIRPDAVRSWRHYDRR